MTRTGERAAVTGEAVPGVKSKASPSKAAPGYPLSRSRLTCLGSGPDLGLVPPQRCDMGAALTAPMSHRCGAQPGPGAWHEADVTGVA